MDRYTVLRDCLTLMEGHQRLLSKNDSKVEAKPGCEEAWKHTEESCEIIREMLREERYGKA